MAITKDLVEYIKKFEKHAEKCMGRGTVEMYMLYSYECDTCQMEFNHFKNYLGIKFDGKMTIREQSNFDMIACRLRPVNVDSRLGKELIDESKSWADETNNPDLVIKFKPTFIDAVTHEKRGVGFIPFRPLRDMLSLNKIPMRRRNFQDAYTRKLNRPCDTVACGMKSKVKVRKLKKSAK